jgi:hypothetical protein
MITITTIEDLLGFQVLVDSLNRNNQIIHLMKILYLKKHMSLSLVKKKTETEMKKVVLTWKKSQTTKKNK